MESELLSSVNRNSSTDSVLSPPEVRLRLDDLAEVSRAVSDDCRIEPETYREEIRMAASGE